MSSKFLSAPFIEVYSIATVLFIGFMAFTIAGIWTGDVRLSWTGIVLLVSFAVVVCILLGAAL